MHLLRLLAASALLVLLGCPARFAAGPPNIVFILADDQGWTDLSSQGSRYYETPNIDRLASQGLRFDSFSMSQNCAPTRAALMSGQYAPRTGVYTVDSLARGRAADRKMLVPKNETELTLDVQTMADVLRSAGYVTGMFGKWHLGSDAQHHPAARGFTEAIETEPWHFAVQTIPPTDVPKDEYLADWITDRGVDFIERHRDERFFLYLPHFAVHAPYVAKPEYVQRWKGKPPVGGHRSATYAAMIQSVDESVGRIVETLERLGLAENTVVVFSSDNGGVGGYDTTEPPSRRRGITDNAPLRGGKGTLYEGGTRVPFIVRWPGRIPAGTTTSAPGIHVDLLPTFADLAKAKPPDQPLDGVSLVPVFEHPDRPLVRRALYHHFPGYLESYVHDTGWRTGPVGVIRDGDLKLLEFFEDGHVELYDVTRDVGERHDLAAERPAEAAALRKKLADWRTSLDAAMPVARDAAP